MKRAALALLLTACAHAPATPEVSATPVPELVEVLQFWSPNHRERLIVAAFKHRGAECLARFEGTNTLYDGVAFPCTREIFNSKDTRNIGLPGLDGVDERDPRPLSHRADEGHARHVHDVGWNSRRE